MLKVNIRGMGGFPAIPPPRVTFPAWSEPSLSIPHVQKSGAIQNRKLPPRLWRQCHVFLLMSLPRLHHCSTSPPPHQFTSTPCHCVLCHITTPSATTSPVRTYDLPMMSCWRHPKKAPICQKFHKNTPFRSFCFIFIGCVRELLCCFFAHWCQNSKFNQLRGYCQQIHHHCSPLHQSSRPQRHFYQVFAKFYQFYPVLTVFLHFSCWDLQIVEL